LVFAVGIVIGSALGRARSGATAQTGPAALIRRLTAGLGPHQRIIALTAARGGAATASVIVAASAIAVVVMLLGNYASIVTLYEAVHAGVLGGISLTVGQIAFLPNLVIWAASWFVGPGFAIGTGSTVSPLGTTLGPIPAVPILGALPAASSLGWGFLGLLVPVLAGFIMALVVRPRLVRDLGPAAGTRNFIVTGLLIGVAGGILLGLLAWASAGSAGPGRLVDVGPSPWLVALFGALEIGIAAALGLIAGRPARGVGR
jgi:hypothetical protein